jgi:hypothetical protein
MKNATYKFSIPEGTRIEFAKDIIQVDTLFAKCKQRGVIVPPMPPDHSDMYWVRPDGNSEKDFFHAEYLTEFIIYEPLLESPGMKTKEEIFARINELKKERNELKKNKLNIKAGQLSMSETLKIISDQSHAINTRNNLLIEIKALRWVLNQQCDDKD